MSVIQPPPAAIALVGCALIAAVFDVRERRIPNKLTGPAFLAGLLLHLVVGGFAGAGWALVAGLIAGGIFMMLHLAGGMGAGDVKLMAALGCIAGMSDVKSLLLATVIAGAVFAICMALSRGALGRTLRNVFQLVQHHRTNGLVAHPELHVRNEKTLRLPYAVPMAVAAALVFAAHLFPEVAR